MSRKAEEEQSKLDELRKDKEDLDKRIADQEAAAQKAHEQWTAGKAELAELMATLAREKAPSAPEAAAPRKAIPAYAVALLRDLLELCPREQFEAKCATHGVLPSDIVNCTEDVLAAVHTTAEQQAAAAAAAASRTAAISMPVPTNDAVMGEGAATAEANKCAAKAALAERVQASGILEVFKDDPEIARRVEATIQASAPKQPRLQ